jgi:hypothetical protein
VFHVGLSPAICHLRRLVIVFNLPQPEASKAIQDQDVTASLKPLLNLTMRPGFQLTIQIRDRSETHLFQAYLLLQHMRPLFHNIDQLNEIHTKVQYHHDMIDDLDLNRLASAPARDWATYIRLDLMPRLKTQLDISMAVNPASAPLDRINTFLEFVSVYLSAMEEYMRFAGEAQRVLFEQVHRIVGDAEGSRFHSTALSLLEDL